VVRQVVVHERAKPRREKLGGLARIIVGLQLLGFITSAIWPTTASRLPAANYITRSICTSSRPPHECQAGVPASEFFGDFVRLMHGEGPG